MNKKSKKTNDENLTVYQVKINTITTFIKYFENRGVSVDKALKGTSITPEQLQDANGWIGFDENKKILINIHNENPSLTVYDWFKAGQVMHKYSFNRMYQVLMLMTPLKTLFRRLPGLANTLNKYTEIKVLSIKNGLCDYMITYDKTLNENNPGTSLLYACGYISNASYLRTGKHTEVKILYSQNILKNIIKELYSPVNIEYTEDNNMILCNGVLTGERIELKYDSNIGAYGREYSTGTDSPNAILIKKDLVVDGITYLKKGDIYNAPYSRAVFSWDREGLIRKLFRSVLKYHNRQDSSEELIKQIRFAEEKYFAEQKARYQLEKTLEELHKKNRIIDKYSKQLKLERDSLEIRVKEKTIDLEAALAKMERLNDFRSRFFINLTHELMTPLTIMRLEIESGISAKDSSSLSKKIFREIFVQTEKMMFLTNNILLYSKNDQSSLKLNKEKILVHKYLSGILSAFLQISSPKIPEIKYINNIPEDLVFSVDTSLFEMAITNILMNAVKFTPGDGKIYINTAYEKNNIFIKISDSGPGIPDPVKLRVFERFFQTDKSGGISSGGLGIGLSLVKEIINLHKGTVHVEDSNTGGSEFVIQLPASAPDTLSTVNRNRPGLLPEPIISSPIAKEESCHNNSRILLVEDNLELSEILYSNLSSSYTIKTATNGKEALEILESEKIKPELIITDLMMPVMDGFTFIKRIMDNDELKIIPVLCLTARIDIESHEKAFSGGVIGYIEKPFYMTDLIHKIEAVIEFKHRILEVEHGTYKLRNDKKSIGILRDKGITKREMEAVELLLTGNSKKDIAAAMKISVNTAKRHIENIYSKMEVHDRFQLFAALK